MEKRTLEQLEAALDAVGSTPRGHGNSSARIAPSGTAIGWPGCHR